MFFTSIVETGDGYLACGYSYVYGKDNSYSYARLVLLKVDKNGNKVSLNAYGSKEKEQIGNKIIRTEDGGYLVGGNFRKKDKSIDIYIAKVDEDGKIDWKKEIGGDNNDIFGDMIITDNSYVILGSTVKETTGEDFFLIVLDKETHDKILTKKIGGKKDENGNFVMQTDDGNFLLVGTRSKNESEDEVYVIKVDNEGEKIWQNIYGGEKDNICKGIAILGNECVIGGFTNSDSEGSYDAWMFKIDAGNQNEGKVIWEKTLGGEKVDYFNRLKETIDGGFVAIGVNTSKTDSEGNIWVLKVDNNGKLRKK